MDKNKDKKKPRPGQKQWPKTSGKAFYLGDKEEKKRRLASLDKLAKELRVRGASTIVQIIADVPLEIMAEVLRPLLGYYKGAVKVKDDSVRSDDESE